MENLISDISFLKERIFLREFVIGMVFSGLILVGFYTGLSINKLLKIISKGYIAGIIGGIIACFIAKQLAINLDSNLKLSFNGIIVGGLFPYFFVLFLEKHFTNYKFHKSYSKKKYYKKKRIYL